MLAHYKSTKKICFFYLRTPKEDAYFLYFTLESNEGLCYFSTLDESLKTPYRDILVRCPIEFKDEVHLLLESLQSRIRVDLLKEETLVDDL